MKRCGLFAVLSTILAAGSAVAQEQNPAPPPAFTPSVTPTGRVFAQYTNNLASGEEKSSAFELTRIYLGAKAKIAPKVSAAVVLDGGRFGALSVDIPSYSLDASGNLEQGEGTSVSYDGGNNRLQVFVKNAFVQLDDVLVPGLALQAGMIGTPFIGFNESMWKNRYIVPTFADYWKLLSSADLGVGLTGNHLDGLIAYQLEVINGEGFKKPELNQHQTFAGRVTVTPFVKSAALKGLRLTGFGDYGIVNDEGEARSTAIGELTFEHPFVTFDAGYALQSQADASRGGFYASVFVTPIARNHVLLRYDRFDPDGTGEADGQSLLVAGLSHDFAKGVSVALDFQLNRSQDSGQEAEKAVGIHSVFEF